MNKKLFFAILILSLIGFATGVNYCNLIKDNSFICAEKCLQFGLYGIACKKSFRKIFAETVFSTIKWFALIYAGAFSWFTFPVTIISSFFLSFRMGMIFQNIFLIFKSFDFISVFFIVLFSVVSVAYSTLSVFRCLAFRIKHNSYKKIDFSDFSAFRSVIIEFFIFLALCVLIDFLIIISKCSIKGMIFSFI